MSSKTNSEALVPTNGAAATELVLRLGANLTAVSLDVTDLEMPYENWENIGRALGFVGNAWQWWVGDWLNFGEALFGEEAAQAVDDKHSRYDMAKRVTGLEQTTLQNIRSVCAKVAKSRRRPELGFYLHQEVAALDPDDQNEWLGQAVDNLWSKSELREAIRSSKHGPPPEPDEELEGQSRLSVSERRDVAAQNVLAMAQTMSNGGWFVPDEAMAQLRAVYGGE